MSRRKDRDRLYQKRGGYYADLRNIGGGLEALKPSGSRYATENREEANRLLVDRLAELKD